MEVITVKELRHLIKSNQKPLIIDVREADELTAMPFIEGSATHIPLNQLSAKVQGLPDRPLYFLCHVGGRSAMACQLAEVAGYEQVYNIQGGILAWYQLLEEENK